MERFAQALTGGGLALVAGLWLAELSTTGSSPWLAGVLLAVLGTGGLLFGTVRPLDVGDG